MPDTISNQSTDSLPQPSTDERLSRIEKVMTDLLAGQQRILSELVIAKEDARQRYVDLRERIEINNDKLGVVQRELNQIAKDIRNPAFN